MSRNRHQRPYNVYTCVPKCSTGGNVDGYVAIDAVLCNDLDGDLGVFVV